MTAIITEKFRLANAETFHSGFSGSDKYFLFIGKSTGWSSLDGTGVNDGAPPTPADDVSSEFYYWDDMIAAKNLASTDVSFVIPRRNWATSTVYDMYEDDVSASNTATSGAKSIFSSTMFFMTTAFRVYKVLYNNAGVAMSGSEPVTTSTTPFWSGGYLLQYMYTMTTSEVNKFLTTDFMPVSTDSTVSSGATDGAIDAVIVTAGGSYTNGTYYCPVQGDGTNAGTASGAILKVIVSGGNIQAFGETDGTNTTIQANGAGYTYGTVNLTANVYSDATLDTAVSNGLNNVSSGSGGSIDIIISPKGGHGYNAPRELGGHYVMLNTTLTQAEGDDITVGNDFRRVGIIKNPYAFGTTSGSTYSSETTARMTKVVRFADSVSGTFAADEKISQTVSGQVAVGKVVEWDSSLRLLYYQQERHKGYGSASSSDGSAEGDFTPFSGTGTITGGTSGATGTPTGTTETVTLANSNTLALTSGYANPELQPDHGDIIYIENRKPISRASDQTEDIKIIVEF